MTATAFAPDVTTPSRTFDDVAAASPVRDRTTTRTKVFRLVAGFGVILAVIGTALLLVGNYTHDLIREQLVSQQITFPPAGSPGLSAEEYPGLQQYGGQLVDDGPKAKAWANQFMTPHILELSGGVPYGVYSANAFMNPQDEQMAAISKQMAIGEVQRGLLLSAWGWWTVGTITWTAGLVLLIVGGIAVVAAGIVRIRSLRIPAARGAGAATAFDGVAGWGVAASPPAGTPHISSPPSSLGASR
jgi:hypothetical protein